MRLQLRFTVVLIGLAAALYCLTSKSFLPGLCDPQPVLKGTDEPQLFTLSTISHAARLRSLRSWVQHYSRCSLVKEILVVWTKGQVPQVRHDLTESGQSACPDLLRLPVRFKQALLATQHFPITADCCK